MKHSKISNYKIKKILKCFCEDLDASRTARILEINRNTINRYFNIFREAILQNTLLESNKELGEFELDESYFGAKRIRGKRGRGAAGKTPVFGLLKRDGKVYVQIVKNCTREQLLPIIQGKIIESSVIHNDGWKAYDGLILNGYDHHHYRPVNQNPNLSNPLSHKA
jgi:transposase-like protein